MQTHLTIILNWLKLDVLPGYSNKPPRSKLTGALKKIIVHERQVLQINQPENDLNLADDFFETVITSLTLAAVNERLMNYFRDKSIYLIF